MRAIRTIYIPSLLIAICTIVPTVLLKDMMESSFMRLMMVGLTYEVLLILATWLLAIGKEEKKVVIQYLSKYVGKNLGE